MLALKVPAQSKYPMLSSFKNFAAAEFKLRFDAAATTKLLNCFTNANETMAILISHKQPSKLA